MRRRLPDQRLAKLRDLTGVSRREDLVELGRIADEIVEQPPGDAILVDWLGRTYAVGVVHGAVAQPNQRRIRTTGEVFVTAPYERVDSLGAVVIIVAPGHAERLSDLLERGRRTWANRQEVTPAMSSSAAAYGSS